jgi:cytochrome c
MVTLLNLFRLGAAFLTVVLWLGPIQWARAGESGADLYDQECGDCHSLARPGKNKKGPSLVGIMGKQAAAVPNFAYSAALRTANIVWTPEAMDAYIRSPKAVVTGGGKMKYDGLSNAAERAAIIQFLSEQR